MLKLFKTGLLITAIGLSSFALAQPAEDLREACYGDIELGNYLVSIAAGDTPAPADAEMFTDAERTQLTNAVGSPDISGNTVQEKVRVVLEACATGQILQQRNGLMIEQ